MIRNPLFNERYSAHCPAYWAEELARLRDLKSQVDGYGGMDRLSRDIAYLEYELSNASGTWRWAHPSIATSNDGTDT